MPVMREGTIEVEGGRIWYGIRGSDRNATPLLVLHGGPGFPHDYLEGLGALSDERPVIFYDQLGCGNSDRPRDPALWTLDRYVTELHQVRTALGLDRTFILGQSWGGMLAVEYVLTRKPSGLSGLILSGPCLSAPRFIADQRALLAKMPEEIRAVILRNEAAETYDSPDYQEAMTAYYRRHVCRLPSWPAAMERSMEKMGFDVYLHMWGPSEFTATGTLKTCDAEPRLGEIPHPTLLTCGRHDEATPETTALHASLIPLSELVVFEDASHAHHLEKPVEYLFAVRDFLRRVELERHS